MPSRPPTFNYQPFNDFTRITRRKFRVLEDRFGFAVADISSNPYECAVVVRYTNATTAVEANFSTFRHMPVVSLHAVDSADQRLRSGYGLVFLIRERCPELEFDEAIGVKLNAALPASESGPDTKTFSRILNCILGRYAFVLEEHAADFLNGDFTIAPQLDKLARREHRRLQYAASKKPAK